LDLLQAADKVSIQCQVISYQIFKTIF
jgi:hypothetical protein